MCLQEPQVDLGFLVDGAFPLKYLRLSIYLISVCLSIRHWVAWGGLWSTHSPLYSDSGVSVIIMV